MNPEVIIVSADGTRREVWRFTWLDWRNHIRLSNYHIETKTGKQRKWHWGKEYWDAYDKRQNTIDIPPLPASVAAAIRDRLKEEIDKMEVG